MDGEIGVVGLVSGLGRLPSCLMRVDAVAAGMVATISLGIRP